MHSDLIVVTFDEEEEAQKVYDALQRMRKSQLLALENAAVVSKDSAGKVRSYGPRELTVPPEATGDDLLDLLADLIFGTPPERRVRGLVEAGLDEGFLQEVGRAMGGRSSALLFLVRYDSMGDTDELLSALALFKGKVHQTTLSPEAEAAMLREAKDANHH